MEERYSEGLAEAHDDTKREWPVGQAKITSKTM